MLSRILVFICCAIALQAKATSFVGLQNATATFSQTFTGDFSVRRAINAASADGLGWAIDPQEGQNQTAVFPTMANIGFAGGSLLTFTISHAYAVWGGHMLGRFRLSVTTDDRNTLYDCLAARGDGTVHWTVLEPLSLYSSSGEILTKLPDHSIIVSGPLPNTDVFTITAATTLTGITGIRLEALTDPSLPFNGPGRQPENGNFVLSEFRVGIDPIPQRSTLAGLGIPAMAADLQHVEIQTSKDKPQIIVVKSGGDFVAEFKITKARTLNVEAETIACGQAPGGDKIYHCTGAAKVVLSDEGKPPITISGESLLIQPIRSNPTATTSK